MLAVQGAILHTPDGHSGLAREDLFDLFRRHFKLMLARGISLGPADGTERRGWAWERGTIGLQPGIGDD